MKAYDKAIQDFTAAICLDLTNADAFASRALAFACKKEYDHAIADYDEEIRLDPKNPLARADRGRAWLLKRNLQEAVADFDAAVKVDPKNPYAIYYRAVFSLLTHEKGALGGFKAALELGGWRGNVAVYAVLMAYFAAQRDSKADQATVMLHDASARCDTSAWPYPVVKFLRGEIDEAKLVAAATDDDRMTEVRCFLGLKALEVGKQDAARTHFRWVTEHGNASYTQYAISLIELDRLEGKFRINTCTRATDAGRTAALAFAAKTAIAIVLAVVTPLPGQAQAVKDWIGKSVVPRSRTFQFHVHTNDPFAIDGHFAISDIAALAIYRVVKAEGRKLWLETHGERPTTGWALADQVVLVDESIPFVRDQIQANPKDPFPFLIRATVWLDAGELDIALADYSDAIRLDPKLVAAYLSPRVPGRERTLWTRPSPTTRKPFGSVPAIGISTYAGQPSGL